MVLPYAMVVASFLPRFHPVIATEKFVVDTTPNITEVNALLHIPLRNPRAILKFILTD
jgi:hypothetical protein